MRNLDKLQDRMGFNRFQRAVVRYRDAMEPFKEKAATDIGMQVGLLVSGITQNVVMDTADPELLTTTIKYASDISDIPETVLEAYAELVMAMHAAYEMSLRTSPLAGDGNDASMAEHIRKHTAGAITGDTDPLEKAVPPVEVGQDD